MAKKENHLYPKKKKNCETAYGLDFQDPQPATPLTCTKVGKEKKKTHTHTRQCDKQKYKISFFSL